MRARVAHPDALSAHPSLLFCGRDMLARQKISTTTTTILTTTTTRTRTRCEEGRKPQKSTKSAKRSKSGVTYKKGGPVLFLCLKIWFLRFEKRKAKGTKEEKKNGEKKKSQKLGLLLLLWVPQKVSKIFKKKKNKNSLGVLSFKIKARRPTTLIKANKKLLRVTKEREREDGTAA